MDNEKLTSYLKNVFLLEKKKFEAMQLIEYFNTHRFHTVEKKFEKSDPTPLLIWIPIAAFILSAFTNPQNGDIMPHQWAIIAFFATIIISIIKNSVMKKKTL